MTTAAVQLDSNGHPMSSGISGDEMSEKRASKVSTLNQSLDAISEDADDDDVISFPIQTAPDGGYGWVIVLASFLCFVVVDGTIFSFGGYLTEFEREFNSSKSTAAWVASIQSGCYLLVGPVAAALSNSLGCRTVSILGSVLAATGLAASYFAQSISQLCLTAGCIAGIGFGFIYLPAACTISFYFEKKRAFATGIAVCGSGIGGFLLGPITNILLQSIGWKKSILISTGLALMCSLIAAFFKPLNDDSCEKDLEDARDLKQHLPGNKVHNGSTASLPTKEIAAELCSQPELRKAGSGNKITGSQKHINAGSSRGSVCSYRSKLSIDYNAIRHRNLSIEKLRQRRLTSPELKPMLRKDVFLTASLQRIPEYRSQSDISQYHASVLHIPTLLGDTGEKVCGCIPSGMCEALKSMLSIDLMTSPSFWLLAIAGFLTMMGFFIPFMYIVDAAMAKGFTKEKSSILLSVIGITNTAGRVFCGWVSDMPNVNALAINNIALTMGGIATACFPLITSYPMLCAYAAMFGFAIACFAALRSIIVVELFGLEKLTNCFGLLLLFQGVASLIGSPTAGFLYDQTQSYDVTFYFFGAVITLSGLMCIPVNYLIKWERSREKIRKLPTEHGMARIVPATKAPAQYD